MVFGKLGLYMSVNGGGINGCVGWFFASKLL